MVCIFVYSYHTRLKRSVTLKIAFITQFNSTANIFVYIASGFILQK